MDSCSNMVPADLPKQRGRGFTAQKNAPDRRRSASEVRGNLVRVVNYFGIQKSLSLSRVSFGTKLM